MVLQDPDQAGIAAIDLARRRPSTVSANGSAAAERCGCVPVDEAHFRARPGLRVLQMAWHPGRYPDVILLRSLPADPGLE